MSGRAELLSGWAQVLASLGVLAGLILVAAEVRQAKQLSQAETVTQMYSDVLEDNRSIMGEESYKTLYRACIDPDSIQGDDVYLLHSYIQNQLITIQRLQSLEEIADFGTPWEELALGPLSTIFASEFGRQWYKTVRDSVAPEIVAIADHMLENEAYVGCGQFFELLTSDATTNSPPEPEPDDT